jgi:hypothetical protein
VSDSMSPQYIIVGCWIDFKEHVRLKFGSYLQTHEKHSDDMQARALDPLEMNRVGTISCP